MEVHSHRSLQLSWFITLPILLVLAALLVTGCGEDNSPGGLNGITRDPPSTSRNLMLPDESPGSGGKEIALKGASDGLMLVYFGYTSCPDVCPTSMADLRQAMAELDPEERERVKVAMVTVDPDRDTGQVLNGYLGHFFEAGEFHSLRTPDTRQLARVEKAFGASHELGEPDAKGNYDVSHTPQIFAVNDRGIVEVEWPFQTDPDLVAKDLEYLLDQANQDPGA